MNSRINSHSDLLTEKRRLENQITFQKAQLRSEIEDIRTRIAQQLQPVTQAARSVKQLTSAPLQPNVIAHGTSAIVNAVTHRIFPRLSFVIDVCFPSLLRNVSQNLINQLLINLASTKSLVTNKKDNQL